MRRTLTLCLLALLLGGCGDGSEERAELKRYVERMGGLQEMNRQIVAAIVRLDQSAEEISAEELQAARELIRRYVARVQEIKSVDISYRELRVAHDLYSRTLAQANELAVDTGRELRRERGNVAIAARHVEKVTRQHYKALDVLWLRTDQQEPFPLTWPD